MRSKFSFVWAFAAAMFVAGAARGATTPPTFTLGFDGIPADDETVAAGEVKTITLYATIKTENCLDPFGPGGWTMSIAVEKDAASTGTVTPKAIDAKAAKGLVVDAYYIQDVDGLPDTKDDDITWPHYIDYLTKESLPGTGFDLGESRFGGNAFFSITQAATSDYTPLPTKNPPPAGLKGIIIGEVMGSMEMLALQPTGTVRVAKFNVEVKAPAIVKLSFVDNLKGAGQPTPNSVTFSGTLSTGGSYDLSTPDYLKLTTATFKVGKEVVTPKCTYADDFAFFFGPNATPDAYPAPAPVAGVTDVKVGLRNKGAEGLGLSLGVKKTGTTLAFFDDPNAAPPAPTLDLLFTKTDGKDVPVAKGNTATGAEDAATIDSVTIAGTIPKLADGALFVVGYNAAKTEARIGYVSDGGTTGGKILPTTDDDTTGACGIQEVFNVQLKSGVVATKFSRGDANADTKINVTDAVVIAQNIFANKLVFKNCKAMLDVDDNGRLEVNDPVALLTYIFVPGTAAPNAPFRTCAAPATVKIECVESNCQ